MTCKGLFQKTEVIFLFFFVRAHLLCGCVYETDLFNLLKLSRPIQYSKKIQSTSVHFLTSLFSVRICPKPHSGI